MQKKRILYVVVLILFLQNYNNYIIAQTPIIDQLRKQLALPNDVQKKQTIYLKLCEQYYSLSADSLKLYVDSGLVLSKIHSSIYFRFKNFYSFYYLKLGKAPEANKYLDSIIAEASKHHVDDLVMNEMQFHKTTALIRDNQIKEAIQTGLKFLSMAEKTSDTLSVLRAYGLLGWANMELESELEAIKWLDKGLKYSKNKQYLTNANSICLNIASCYNLIGKADSAHKYVNLGLELSQEIENLTNQANALNIRAAIYSKADRTKEALRDLEEGLSIRQKIGDMHYIISDMAQLSHYYSYVHQPEKGIAIALKAIPMAIASNNLYKLIYIKKGLYKNYEETKDQKQQVKTLLEILDLKDSLYEMNTVDAIADMKAQYELQKRENIIIQQKHTLNQNRYFLIGGIITALLGAIIVWLIYRNRSHRQKLKLDAALNEEKLNSIRAIKMAEEKERKRIAADLHDNLGSYAAAITSNIGYLRDKGQAGHEQLIAQLDENAQGIVTQLSDSIWVLKK